MATATMVTLKCDAIGCAKRQFELTHAERLLSMRKNGGWELADDNYTWDGNILRRNKGKDKGKSEKKGD
jgi:hypothetical protein